VKEGLWPGCVPPSSDDFFEAPGLEALTEVELCDVADAAGARCLNELAGWKVPERRPAELLLRLKLLALP
jgi:hypothetical protein